MRALTGHALEHCRALGIASTRNGLNVPRERPVEKGGTLQGFEIAGDDHHFTPANARIDGQTVLVSSGQVSAPKYVRYGWANAPVVNLFNGAGLPASPFTSEEKIPTP